MPEPGEIVGDFPKWSATKHRAYAYHDDADCDRVDDSTVHERSEDYINWHELSACAWCHDQLEPDPVDRESCTRLAKRLRYGDLREEVVGDD